MLEIYRRLRGINPVGIYVYIDVVRVWLKQPLSERQAKDLRSLCGKGGMQRLDARARFDTAYCQQLRLYQPSREAIEWLAARNDVHLNYDELSMDWIFEDEDSRDRADDLIRALHVKKHHRTQQVAYAGEGGVTRYSGPRRAPTVFVSYGDKPSKVTGEEFCLHFDWRVNRADALRRMGIESINDLLTRTPNPHTFWLQRLLLYGVDLDALGRLYHRHHSGTTRRSPWIVRYRNGFTYNMDRRMGSILYRACGSTQEVLDRLGPKFGRDAVWRCLIAMDDRHLLPSHDDTFL